MTQPTEIKNADLLRSQTESLIGEYIALKRELFHLFADTEDERDPEAMNAFSAHCYKLHLDRGICFALDKREYNSLRRLFMQYAEKFIIDFNDMIKGSEYINGRPLLYKLGPHENTFFTSFDGINARIKALRGFYKTL